MPRAGSPTDLSFLDPVNEADAPPQAVRLAAGELLLRIEEERRRRAAGLGPAAGTIAQRRMAGKAGALLELFIFLVIDGRIRLVTGRGAREWQTPQDFHNAPFTGCQRSYMLT